MMYVAGPGGVSFLVGLGLTVLLGRLRLPLWLGLAGVLAATVAIPLLRGQDIWQVGVFCLLGGLIGFGLGWRLAARW